MYQLPLPNAFIQVGSMHRGSNDERSTGKEGRGEVSTPTETEGRRRLEGVCCVRTDGCTKGHSEGHASGYRTCVGSCDCTGRRSLQTILECGCIQWHVHCEPDVQGQAKPEQRNDTLRTWWEFNRCDGSVDLQA